LSETKNTQVRKKLPPVKLENDIVYDGEWLNGMRDG